MLSSNPGRIRAELAVAMPRPRDRHDPGFEQLVDTVYGILTGREEAAERAAAAVGEAPPGAPAPTPADLPLPEVSAGGLSGLLEILAARGGQDGLAELADDLSFEIDDLLPLVDAAVMLGLAHVHDAQLEITRRAATSPTPTSTPARPCSATLVAAHAPLIKAILRALRATGDGTLREGFFLDLLRRGFSADEARRQLDIAIDWGRYGELFQYDGEDGELILTADPPAGRTSVTRLGGRGRHRASAMSARSGRRSRSLAEPGVVAERCLPRSLARLATVFAAGEKQYVMERPGTAQAGARGRGSRGLSSGTSARARCTPSRRCSTRATRTRSRCPRTASSGSSR